MGRIVFKQPNGLYGMWSTIADGPIYWNMTKQDYIDAMLEEAKTEIRKKADEIFENNHNVSNFSSLKDYYVANMTKEEFNSFLKSCGSLLTSGDFCFYGDLSDEENSVDEG